MQSPRSTSPLPVVLLGAALLTANAMANSSGATSGAEPQPSRPDELYFGDVDGDGLDDVLAIDSSGHVALLLNLGEGRFEDITLPSGLAALEGASCAVLTDLDGDGRVDLFVGSSEQRLWRNLGGASFVAVESGITHDLIDFSATAIDHDGDGRLDLHLRTEGGDQVYRNVGAGRFEPVELPGVGLGAASVRAVVVAFEGAPSEVESTTDASPTRRRLGRWMRARRALDAASSPSGSSALSAAGPGINVTSVTNLALAAPPTLICAGTIVDQANGSCIEASSNATLGKLYPLSTAFNVSATGNVGINTTTPNARLAIGNVGGVNGASLLGFGEGALAEFYFESVFAPSGGDNAVAFSSSIAGVGDIMTWEASGNVGIGTTTPSRPLHLVSDQQWGVRIEGDTLPGIQIENYGSGSSWAIYHDAADNLNFRDSSTGATRMVVRGDTGHVGIGTETPSKPLHVRNGSTSVTPTTNAELVVEGTSDASISLITAPGQECAIFFGNQAAGANDGAIVWNQFGGALPEGLAFRTNDTNRLTISQSGLVSVKQTLEIRGGADIVERFDASDEVEPGTVVVIDPAQPGKLKRSNVAYDAKVAGVVSGAGGVNPGLCLSQDGRIDGDTLVAMNGRVYVKATAANGAIQPGDRLTTSALAGHAMKATDGALSDGAVLGKAMTALEAGEGLVLVLVNLQ